MVPHHFFFMLPPLTVYILVPGKIKIRPAIGQNGEIYFGEKVLSKDKNNDSYFYALNPPGKIKWKYKPHEAKYLSTLSAQVIGNDGSIYVLTHLGLLALNPNGTQKWLLHIDLDPTINLSLAIGSDELLYFCILTKNRDGKFYSIHSESGDIKVEFGLDSRGYGAGFTSPVVDRNGNIYLGSSHGRVYCLGDERGRGSWDSRIGGKILHSPVLTSDETVIFGTATGLLYALDTKKWGKKKWEFKTNNPGITAPLTVGPGSTLYFVSGSVLYTREFVNI